MLLLRLNREKKRKRKKKKKKKKKKGRVNSFAIIAWREVKQKMKVIERIGNIMRPNYRLLATIMIEENRKAADMIIEIEIEKGKDGIDQVDQVDQVGRRNETGGGLAVAGAGASTDRRYR